MAETLALIPFGRQERRGIAGFTEYLLSDDVTAILEAKNAIFLPESSSKVEDITPEVAAIMTSSVVDGNRVQIRNDLHTCSWQLRNNASTEFTVRIWDSPFFVGITTQEEVLLLAFEHGKVIVPMKSTEAFSGDDRRMVILADEYILKLIVKEYVLVEYDPVKAVRILIQRLNRAGKPHKKPPPKRLSKDDYYEVIYCLRGHIYKHPAIEAGVNDVITRCWGLPRERSCFIKSLLYTKNMAEMLFGRKKPWRKKLKPILSERKNLILRALENPKLTEPEREGIEWLLGEMRTLRLPGLRAWLKRTGYQATPATI